MKKSLLVGAAALSLIFAPVGTATASSATVASSSTSVSAAAATAEGKTVVAAAKKYKNCTALNKKYKHGVGKKGAKDKVKGKTKPVKNFKVSNDLYKANKHLDRDKDGIACEKK